MTTTTTAPTHRILASGHVAVIRPDGSARLADCPSGDIEFDGEDLRFIPCEGRMLAMPDGTWACDLNADHRGHEDDR